MHIIVKHAHTTVERVGRGRVAVQLRGPAGPHATQGGVPLLRRARPAWKMPGSKGRGPASGSILMVSLVARRAMATTETRGCMA